MNESISIHHLRNIDLGDLNGFKDVIGDSLREQGARVMIDSAPVSPLNLDGGAVRITWAGQFCFITPDGERAFGSEVLSVEVTADRLDHTLLLKLLAARSFKLEQGYRQALSDIYNLAEDMREGRVPKGADPLDYLTRTIEAAAHAFPNHR